MDGPQQANSAFWATAGDDRRQVETRRVIINGNEHRPVATSRDSDFTLTIDEALRSDKAWV